MDALAELTLEVRGDLSLAIQKVSSALLSARETSGNDKQFILNFLKQVCPFARSVSVSQVGTLMHTKLKQNDINLRSMTHIVLLSNTLSMFASQTLELECIISRLRIKLKHLVVMDGDADHAFQRFHDKKTRNISRDGFKLMVKQLLRGDLPKLSAGEINIGLFRYLDPSGRGHIRLDDFKRFCEEDIAAVFEHTETKLLDIAIKKDPLVVVDVVHTAVNQNQVEQEELIDLGFERALGVDVGLWIKRSRKRKKDTFQVITDLVWAPKMSEDLISHGYIELARPQVSRWFHKRDPLEKSFWIRRNSDSSRAITDVLIQPLGEMPPCSGFTVSQSESTIWLRYLTPSENSELQILENEFKSIANNQSDPNQYHIKQKRMQLMEKRFRILQFNVHEALAGVLIQGIEEGMGKVPNTETVFRETDKHKKGWITYEQMSSCFRKLGIYETFTSKKLFKTFLGTSKVDESKTVYIIDKILNFLKINPSRVYMCLLDMVEINKDLVDQVIQKRSERISTSELISKSEFLQTIAPLFRDTRVPLESDDMKGIIGCFQGKDRKLDMELFLEVLALLRQDAKTSTIFQSPSSLGIQIENLKSAFLKLFPSPAHFGDAFESTRITKVSIAKFKNKMKQVCQVSDLAIDHFITSNKLDFPFLTPEIIQLATVSLSQNYSQESFAVDPAISDSSDEEPDVERHSIRDRITREEMEHLRSLLTIDIQEYLLGVPSDSVLIRDFEQRIIQAGIVVEDLLLKRYFLKSHHSDLRLDRKFLLRTLWPNGPVHNVQNFRIVAALSRLKKVIEKSLLHGVDADRIRTDVLYYQAGSSNSFSKLHLVSLVRKLVSNSKIDTEDAEELSNELLKQGSVSLGEALESYLFDNEADSMLTSSDRDMIQNRLHSADPIQTFREKDIYGRGILSKKDFVDALKKVSPGLPAFLIQKVVRSFQNTNHVVYTGRFEELMTVNNPSRDLEELMVLIQLVRAQIHRQPVLRQHFWSIFRRADTEGYNVLPIETFRSVLYDSLNVGHRLSEYQFRTICRWYQHEDEIDYLSFCKSLGPSQSVVNKVVSRIRNYLDSSSKICNGFIDMRFAFTGFDEDENGYISRRHFHQAFVKTRLLPVVVTLEDVQCLVEEFDSECLDMVDYVSFCALAALPENTEFYFLIALAQKLQRYLAKQWIFDQHSEYSNVDDFILLLQSMSIPVTQKEMESMATFFKWGNYIDMDLIVRDLIRSCGPGGIFCSTSPPGTIFKKQGRVWDSENARNWLQSQSSQDQSRFIEMHHSLKASKRNTNIAFDKPKSKSCPLTGCWTCPVCNYRNATVRYSQHCTMCDRENPYLL